MAQEVSLENIAGRFCAQPLPESVCADLCATMCGYRNRTGTNLLTFAEAVLVLGPVIGPAIEAAFRAGHAAAEETLGAHGSERLLDAIESAWTQYASDNGFLLEQAA